MSYEKAEDSLSQESILHIFTKGSVPTHLIKSIQSVCQNKKLYHYHPTG